MNKKNDEKIDLNKIPREEMLKYEIAEELGLLDQVLESGRAFLPRRPDESAAL